MHEMTRDLKKKKETSHGEGTGASGDECAREHCSGDHGVRGMRAWPWVRSVRAGRYYGDRVPTLRHQHPFG